MATLYDTLGVPTHATDEEIKRAYRKAAMKWHPDRNSGAEEVARATFQEIKDAYAILSDAAQRKVYDAVYAPLETGLLKAARARGLETVDGLEMLVGQAALAFELFFGAEPPRDRDDELRALLTA